MGLGLRKYRRGQPPSRATRAILPTTIQVTKGSLYIRVAVSPESDHLDPVIDFIQETLDLNDDDQTPFH